MALTVDYSTAAPWLITVPKADLALISGTQYELTVDNFWSLMTDFSDNEVNMARPELYSRIPATSSTPSITTINLTYYQIEFEDGLYSVNIVNGNTNVREAEVKNQVSVNTNNTTGFIDQSILVHSTFNSGIYWDNVSGKAAITDSSTDGNEANPLLNMADVVTQATALGFNKIHVVSDATVPSTPSVDGYLFEGQSRASTAVTFGDGSPADTGDTVFINMHMTGALWGGINAKHCIVDSLTGVGCTVKETILDEVLIEGNITLRADNSQPVALINCGSINNNQMVLDVNGTTGNITIHNYTDRLKIINMTSAIDLHVSSAAGCEFTIDASCTAVGLLEVHGNVNIINNSALSIDDDTSQFLTWQNGSALTVGKFLALK